MWGGSRCAGDVWSLFCGVVPSVLSSFAMFSEEKRAGCFTFDKRKYRHDLRQEFMAEN